jgi:hypothetical protein
VISQPIRKGAPHTVEPLTGRPRPMSSPLPGRCWAYIEQRGSRVHRYWPKPPRRCASYAPALVFATPDQPSNRCPQAQQTQRDGSPSTVNERGSGGRVAAWTALRSLGQVVIVRGDTGPPTSRTPLPKPSSRFAGFSATSTDVSDTNTQWQHPPSTSLADAGRPLSHRASAHNYCTYEWSHRMLATVVL